MDRKENVVSNYRSIVDYMSKVINDKCIKVAHQLSLIKDIKYPKVQLYDNKRKIWCQCSKAYEIDGKWYFDFSYEDTCLSNSLPCEDYRDSIIGMTVKEVENYFLCSNARIYDNDGKTVKEFNV